MSNPVRDMNSRFLVSFVDIMNDLGVGLWRYGACYFFSTSMYGGYVGSVVSDVEAVESGRFGLLIVGRVRVVDLLWG